MPGRTLSAEDYRFGFNGKENLNDVKGIGKLQDFGARIYDTRLGRWLTLDGKSSSKQFESNYSFVKNNPIIFLDPDGYSEFYSVTGKWIGTDGSGTKDKVLVTSKDLVNAISEVTKSGLNYITPIPETQNFVLPHDQVLVQSVDVFSKTVQYGGKAEFMKTLKLNESGNYDIIQDVRGPDYDPRESSANSGVAPLYGDVNIHSHPLGIYQKPDKSYSSFDANEPSPADISNYDKNKVNIIVGKQGDVLNPKSYFEVGDMRENIISISDQNQNKSQTISIEAAKRILSGDRGKLGKQYEKNKTK